MSIYSEAIAGDHVPLITDGIPTVGASEAAIATDAAAALRWLKRRDALDLADMTRAYTPAKVTDAEKAVATAFRKAGGEFDPDNQTAFGVDVTFHSGTRQRRDVDNMLKLILDGLNGVAWVDDTQVLDIVGRKRFTTKADARTEVAIYRTGRLGRLTAKCERCRNEFPTYESLVGRIRFCSVECRKAAGIEARRRLCEHCETEFLAHGPTHKTRWCSRECRSASGRVTIPCKICATPFEQYKSWATRRPYCSEACVKENARRKAAERRRAA